jgi:2-oxo-4-hydroxy-4-carboxy--5-ureidoimidazoline (OHCU) decarboxylase
MAKQMREALEAAGVVPTRRFPEKHPKSAERIEREERQAAAAASLEKARAGLAAMTKKDN